MTVSWDDAAAGWDSNEGVQKYADLAFESLRNIHSLRQARILDFGCGTGLLTEKLAEEAASVIAIDSSEKMISVLAEKVSTNKGLANVEPISLLLNEVSVRNTPALQKPFDLIVASSVCAFLPDYPGTLALLTSLLKTGGSFVQWDWLKAPHEQGYGLDAGQIKNAFHQAGLENCSVTTPFSLNASGEKMVVIMGVGTK